MAVRPTTKRKSALQKIPQYKMKIMNELLKSDVIANLLYYNTENALFKEALTDEQKFSLLYDKIFPYRFMPKTIEEQGTWINLGVNYFRKHEIGYDIYSDYQAGELYFYMFTHTDLMRTNSGVRQDILLGEIDNIFNGKKDLGMGELQLRSSNELWLHNNKFGGYSIGFTIIDMA